jgi:FkbM family methyltransferase
MWGTKIKDLPFKLVVQSEIEIWRAADFWKKEPETIAWIDSFAPGSVFWDIGANIGTYSLYADKTASQIYAFEPDEVNFSRLKANFKLQDFTGRHAKWCAISDFDGKSTFYVRHQGPGHSGGQVGAAVDEEGREFKPAESYEVETYKIDTLAGRLGVPNHIKIDVDGHEWQILQGANATLQRPEVKSVLVEVNKGQYADIDGYMKSFGFSDFNRFNGPDINRRANQKSRNVIYLRQ